MSYQVVEESKGLQEASPTAAALEGFLSSTDSLLLSTAGAGWEDCSVPSAPAQLPRGGLVLEEACGDWAILHKPLIHKRLL